MSRSSVHFIYFSSSVSISLYCPPGCGVVSDARAAPLPDNGSRVLDKVVDQHRPGALLVVVGEVVVDGEDEVEQQVPGVARDVAPVVLLGIREMA